MLLPCFLLYFPLGKQILDTFVPLQLVWLLPLQKSTLQKETKPFSSHAIFTWKFRLVL